MCTCRVRGKLMDYQDRLRHKKFRARKRAKYGFYATAKARQRQPVAQGEWQPKLLT